MKTLLHKYKPSRLILMIRIYTVLFSSLLLCFTLTGCGSSRDSSDGLLTPMPGAANDPDDGRLLAAVKDYIGRTDGPANSRFEYTRTDLNGDGLREGLVLFKSPHTYWCGWGGCSMVIFQGHEEGFSYVSKMINVRGPLMISEHTTDGWRDLVVRVSGTNMADHNVAMSYDGRGYPANPLTETEIRVALRSIPGRLVFP